MAKSAKIEDYWRQHNIEGLFRDLTHTIAQRMPPDPAVAIVQQLQKKFPKSFKTPIDSTNDTSINAQTTVNNLQLPITSSSFGVNIGNREDTDMQRRASVQSQLNNSVTIPTAGSAFTDLLKTAANNSNQAPEQGLRNVIFANRFTQQVVRSGKDFKSDHDILNEELIQPIKAKENGSSTTHASLHPISEDVQKGQTHEEPSVSQLMQIKNQIRNEKDHRRLHQEDLAELAKKIHDQDQTIQSDLFGKPQEIQQQKGDDDHRLSQNTSESTHPKKNHKPFGQSKEEEEILNDENLFQSGRPRRRERQGNKLSTSRGNTSPLQKQYARDLRTSSLAEYANSKPMVQFVVCKVCGNTMSTEQNQSKVYSQPVSAIPTARSIEPQQSTRSLDTSDAAVDDWFEAASDVSSSRQVLQLAPDQITPPPNNTNPFQRNLFQPISDHSTDVGQRRSPTVPLIVTDDQAKARQSTTSHLSESDIFVRTPSPKNRPPSSPRNLQSPVTKKQQTDTLAITNQQLSKTIAHPPRSRKTPSPTLATTIVPITQRRMSGWSVREHSPDNSDEN